MGAGALTRENAGLVVKERLKNNSSAASMLRYLESHASLHAPPAIFARLLLFEAWQIINEDVFCAGTESFIRCHILRRANVLHLLPLSGWVREKEGKRKKGRECRGKVPRGKKKERTALLLMLSYRSRSLCFVRLRQKGAQTQACRGTCR